MSVMVIYSACQYLYMYVFRYMYMYMFICVHNAWYTPTHATIIGVCPDIIYSSKV